MRDTIRLAIKWSRAVRDTIRLAIKRFPEIGVSVSFGGVCIIFAFLNAKFFTVNIWAEILATASELGIIAAPVALLMISGNFDLSVGGVYALSGMSFLSALNAGLHPIVSLAVAIATGTCIGFVNGMIVTKVRIHSFIVTLGMMFLLRGLMLVWTKGFPVSVKGGRAAYPVLFASLAGRIGKSPFRASAVWFIIITGILAFVLSNTRHGSWTFATGGDIESARAEGVPVDRVQLVNFIAVGFLSAVSGLLLVGRMFTGFPTLGTGFELEAIASAVLGGCLLMGGVGTIVGAFIGTLLVSTMRIGLVLAGAPVYWYKAFIGLLLLGAVILREKIK